jgi:AAA domain
VWPGRARRRRYQRYASAKSDGYTVIGTATSGQAARSLGVGSGIEESRTLASLLWRLDHDRIRLGTRHAVVLDESGMTADADLGRLLAAVHAAGARIVIVGDDRQLGAVGPGGGLGALLARHADRVWHLTENVRQQDVTERDALAELRSGDLDQTLAWYAGNRRVLTAPTNDEVLDGMVARWAGDVASGRDTILLAWRRDNVDALNRRARVAWAGMGRLSGPELQAPGGRHYAAGDVVVALAPGPGGAWVTSQRATVVSVSVRAGSLKARTDDGRILSLDRDATGAERLAYGYAITVHRSQGATYDTVHALEDGGGRKLAYVKMSRARRETYLYIASPSSDDAVEHLGWAWGAERRETWATDRGQPDVPAVANLAELQMEQLRLTRLVPAEVHYELAALRRDLAELDRRWRDLHAGEGDWARTPAGMAGRALTHARAEHARAVEQARDTALPYVEHRRAVRAQRRAERSLNVALRAWDRHAQP